MKHIATLLLVIGIVMSSCGKGNVDNLKKPGEFNDKVSYMIGKDIGNSFAQQDLKSTINIDYLLLGLKHGMDKDSTFITAKELDSVRNKFQEMMLKLQDKKMKEDEAVWRSQATKNKELGDKFLAENKGKPGVVTTASGLQYQILKEGSGKIPVEDDVVKIHLKGSYLDGKEFDNTYTRQPADVGVSQSVPGWKEAFSKMKVGSIWRIWLPYQLGWGEMGAKPTIPPSAVLIFEIELLDITGKQPAQSGQPGQPGQPR